MGYQPGQPGSKKKVGAFEMLRGSVKNLMAQRQQQ